MGTVERICTACHAPLPEDAAFCPVCGAPTPTRRAAEVPHGFAGRLSVALAGRYRMEREIGRGGMAVVYLAHDLRHERQVAVKALRPELAASVGADRFLREIKLAARLAHRNILALYDSGEADGFLYYVMPYVDGESLRQKLGRERQLPIDEALRIAREVGEGLDFAHEQGVVHRDIKPENVLLSRGHALIADFGIAKAFAKSGMSHLTSTGTSVGTPLYMSPEQAAGDPDIDQRADVYSLACMLYEMLAGEPPFTGPTTRAIIAKHTLEPRPAVRTLRDTVPVAVEAAIQRAMAKAPADRFGSVAAFTAALEPPPARTGEVEPPAGRVPVPSPRGARIRRGSWVIAALGIAAVAALGYVATHGRARGTATARYPDAPDHIIWTAVTGENFPMVAVAGSALVVQPFGADAVYTYDGHRWAAAAVPDSFTVAPHVGVLHDRKLIAVQHSSEADDRVRAQTWWMQLTADGVVPVESLGDFEPGWIYPRWWSDGRDLVLWVLSVQHRTPSGWEPEITGTTGQVLRMWGTDLDHRYALLTAPRDSLLVYDGISWRLEDVVRARTAGESALSGGTTLSDGSAIVFGETCDTAGVCRPLLIEQDHFGERWRHLAIPDGVGIPARTPASVTAACPAARFTFAGAGGLTREDFYVWGDWTSCDLRLHRPQSAGCPAGQACAWHVVHRELRPVEELAGRVILHVLVAADAPYAVMDDGTLWRRVEGTWRRMGQVPDLSLRLVGASPRLIARWKDAAIRFEPGSADTVSPTLSGPVRGLPVTVTRAHPPRRLAVRDTTLALLTSDGSVLVSQCGIATRGLDAGTPALNCSAWQELQPAPGTVADIGFLPDGRVLGVGARGLAVVWDGLAAHRERTPPEVRGDSLWGVSVADDGTAVAVSRHGLLARDAEGRWRFLRTFPGDGGVGRSLAVLPGGDVVVAGQWARVWNRLPGTGTVAVLHQRVMGGPQIGAVHVLPDGRLVAGFENPDRPGVGGWLQVWAVPVGENRSQRVNLPMAIDVTGLADDGTYLQVVGRGGSVDIALDDLPFAAGRTPR